ncbi:non-ribosomal peptide synthetase, partial [uncultured Eubacterium sp.]|uniref:non-ribosomal peptide synthetase n=1 Tax=uncultured Eubacterium sp. TaxID=165185 RepID=UPI00259456D3
DGFFELGGHSLKATRLVNRIEEQTGKRIALKDIFSNQTPEKIAMLVNEIVEEEYIPIPKAEEKEYYPMSSAQKRTYLLAYMDEDGVLYNMPQNFKLTGEVHPDALKDALQKLIDRHEILRTSFIMVDGEPVQKILLHAEADFEYIDGTLTDELKEKDDFEFVNEYIIPFDLSNPPLVRVRLVNRGEYHLLCMDMHHIVSDGMSSAIFTREFNALYNGEELEPLTHQFKDYSEWMRNRDLSNQAKYWKSQFDDEIPVLDMPLDFVRPQEQSFEGNIVRYELGNDLTAKIQKVAKKNNSTDFMVLMSAAMVLLSKYSRQEDIVIGTPISGRTHRDTEDMLGMFVNTLALRGKPEASKTYAEFLKEIKEISLKAYENQEYPFEELVEAVEVNRDMSRSPIFDVMLSLQNNEEEEINLGDSKIEWIGSKSVISKFDLSFVFGKYDDEYQLIIEYCTALYKDDSIKKLLTHFVNIFNGLEENIDKKIGEIEVVDEYEKNVIINEFNNTDVSYSKEKTVIELFEEQVEKTPGNVAVVFEDSKLTYHELNERANVLAHKLRDIGVKQNDYVAIIADRSLEMIQGIWGIVKSGGAYVPIESTYPEERIKFMLEDINPKAVLVYTNEEIDFIDKEVPVIDLADSKVWFGVSENPDLVNTKKDLMYCIYTSGTTGKPKGVDVEHGGTVVLCQGVADKYSLSGKHVLQMTNVTFDPFVEQVFSAHISGATIYVANETERMSAGDLYNLIKENDIEVANVPLVMLRELETYLADECALKTVICGGEQLPENLKNKVLSYGINLYNHYGPTEAIVDATVCDCTVDEKVNIGKPCFGKKAYIVQGNTLCGIGMPGELCIGGELARGYHNMDELTEEKFVNSLYGDGKMYHTGDLARWLPDGNIEFLGRIDEQVKIRGFRVELGEIESRIREIDEIKDVAVIARAENNGNKEIYAYFVVEDGKSISVSGVRDKLGENLPDYMIPAYMMQIEKIPVTKNGKLDKKALPEIEVKTEKEYIAPRNEVEEKICNAFAEILGVEKVGIKDGFFELGGHSLRATKLVNRIEEQTGRRIALKSVFSNQTPEKLAELVGEGKVEEYTPIPKAEDKEYYPMSSAQKRTYLLTQMDPDGMVYNMPQVLKVTGEVRPEALREALQKLIDRHEILRTSFITVDGEPVQKILSHVDAKFEYVEFGSINNTKDVTDSAIIEGFVKVFDLSNPPLVRVKLVNRGEYYLLCMDMHHIISDGMSMSTFIRELNVLYSGVELKPLTHQFKDYSEWMRTRDLASQSEYWKSQFDDEIPVLDMPLDFTRSQEQSYKGAMVGRGIGKELTAKIKEMAMKNGVTDFMVFMSATMVLLSKYSRQEDIVVGTPISGRTHKDTEGMLGMFVNTLAMRGKPEANKTYKEFLNEIKEISLNAYENQEYPFEELVEVIDVERDMSRNPLFDVMFVLQNNEEESIDFGSSDAEWVDSNSVVAKFDLSFNVFEQDDEYKIGLVYCRDLYRDESAEGILSHYISLLEQILLDMNKKLMDLTVINEEEKAEIINEFNGVDVDYPKQETVAEIFEKQVEKTPDNIAVVFEESK